MQGYSIAKTPDEYKAAEFLFKEYAAWLNIDLCFQGFEKELHILPEMYEPGKGGIILCREGDEYIGCVGIRRLSTEEAEMKRMWVRRGCEGKGIGKELLQRAIRLSKDCGYQKIKLDTLRDMAPAIHLYTSNGFVEIPAYYHNPDERALYLEKIL